jgi:dTDP-4-dehydrorhamnose reductase
MTGPTGVYGASKLAGERGYDESAVLGVAWVHSRFDGNFVKTVLRLTDDRNQMSMVADQAGNPTSALAIADGITRVATAMVSNGI